jgi:hypothetical protein
MKVSALWKRIRAGETTGSHLAEQTGFKQAHISNFLNRKRGLSLEGMDRALSAQRLSVLDLIEPEEINRRASVFPPRAGEFLDIAVTDSWIAATEVSIRSMYVHDAMKIRKSFLKRLRSSVEGDRAGWERFVIIHANQQQCVRMYPRLMPRAALLLDRHYNSLTPYRKGEKNMYVVRKDDGCSITYVELAESCLILRPHNPAEPVEIIPLGMEEAPGDHIVGRVCYIESEA